MAKARVFELSKSIRPVPEVPGQKREKWFFLDKPLSWMSISIPRCFGWHMQHLCGALLLSLLGLLVGPISALIRGVAPPRVYWYSVLTVVSFKP